jgi:hypothetical protein
MRLRLDAKSDSLAVARGARNYSSNKAVVKAECQKACRAMPLPNVPTLPVLPLHARPAMTLLTVPGLAQPIQPTPALSLLTVPDLACPTKTHQTLPTPSPTGPDLSRTRRACLTLQRQNHPGRALPA